MNGILINWKIISKGIKKENRYFSDRHPTIIEIEKLLKYPDRRIKPIVLAMFLLVYELGLGIFLNE